MMNITDDEIISLQQTKNAEEWDAACDAIKAVRNNSYPPDWWKNVMMSGIAAKARANWDCDCGINH